MIDRKPKKCKGTGKAKDFGCNEIRLIHQYGLCKACFCDWLYNSENGKKKLSTSIIRAKKQVSKKDNIPRKYIRWTDKDTKEMIIYVQEQIINPYIRLRDIESGYRCISSNGVIEHAGHCFSVGSCHGLRFNIMNIHGQSHMANVHKHGDFDNYRIGLINRYGEAYFNELSKLKMNAEKVKNLDRQEVIRIGKTYEYLTKKNIWCFLHIEFQNYKNILNK